MHVARRLPRKARGSMRQLRHLRTLDELDGRTRASVRTRELLANIAVDLGAHDLDDLTQAQRQLAQRAAVLGALLEDYEVRWAAGEPFELAPYLAGINAQRRVFALLGLKRIARNVPDLSEYLERKRRGSDDDDDVVDAEAAE
jgi:hypothetical protein